MINFHASIIDIAVVVVVVVFFFFDVVFILITAVVLVSVSVRIAAVLKSNPKYFK